MRRSILIASAVGLSLVAFARPGPPGVCHPLQMDATVEKSLNESWKCVTTKNAGERLPEILDKHKTDTIARMDMLRRVAMMESRNPEEIVAVLALRALAADSDSDKSSALFDAGYAIHLYRTLGVKVPCSPGDDIPGYQLVSRAIEMRADAGMHVGAAYMTIPAMQPRNRELIAKAKERFNSHVNAALRACAPNSTEEKNLAFVLDIEGVKVKDARSGLTKQTLK